MTYNCDVLIIGSGLAALNLAINLDKSIDILIVSNSKLKDCNSYLAQGGITTIKDEKDKELFIKDTLVAGENANDIETINFVSENANKSIQNLVKLGVPFNKDKNNNLIYTKEAAHSTNRILYCDDSSGKVIWKTIFSHIINRKNIDIIDNVEIVDIKSENNNCYGAIGIDENKNIMNFNSKITVLATGGIGGLFKNSTNFNNIKGIGVSIALRHNIKVKDLEYIQMHPTAFYSTNSDKRFLISESVRGEGAYIVNDIGERFVNELLPRNKVSERILKEKKNRNIDFVYLDARHLGKNYLQNRFPKIYNFCLENGYDMSKDLIPIHPSQHYFMGGIAVDKNSKTSMNNLYACGEVSCTGLHGKNRLASNSLLEAVVFSESAANSINKEINSKDPKIINYTNNLFEIKKENIKILIDTFKKIREDLSDEFYSY
ncbi:L-aspartate oxidase [Hypnocyclicus thermotrophus]|uniref:L-aspartate oxidase n=1 Tax=Hypnocyclicus thermotrophus TaxID=1627895 RepID=A0AA46I527_9FUSO|nr:L-aspartate oxidase [Hypnocyclicus thermotrophus]TDT68116.1 L-aspartate oxidase [Hypnocyclicus thermotrophus]